jgi:hypothetical protein
MAINKSGKWWKGCNENDIKQYLEEYSEDGYRIHEFRLAKCKCGSTEFRVKFDNNGGVAKRKCKRCNTERYICDSEEHWEDSEIASFKCIECGSKISNVGAGFSLYDDGEIFWWYLGVRCSKCGVLGCLFDCKIGYGPSKHLMEQV